ncbi:hypothetical protein [Prosthecobacter sp.]|uniref:hypothetical protein n=1 Tax=Prosthecobacter sp. TaxID=1965333 RepID=UPI003784A098
MTTIAEIEDSIRALPASSFCELLDWMERRHDQVLQEQGYEPPELEAAMLQALDGPWHDWNDALKERIRQNWKDKAVLVA